MIKRFKDKSFFYVLGRLLIALLPVIIKILSVVGTLALILVSGGIFVHNIEFLHDFLPGVPSIISEFVIGLLAGLLTVGIIKGVKQIFKAKSLST